MKTEPLQYDILKPEAAKMLATLLAELQAKGVQFSTEQDYNIVFVHIQN